MRRLFANERWSLKRLSWWGCCLLTSLTLSKSCEAPVLAANTKAAAFPGTLTLQDGKLTIRTTAVPLRQVMAEVGRLSGAQVLWLGPQDESPVSVDFSGLPVTEALERLLPRKNFLLLYASSASNARLTQIWISSPGSNAEPPRVALRRAPVTEEPKVINEDLPAEELDAELAPVLEAYLQTVLRGHEVDGRVEAIEALGGMAEHDPRIRPLLVQLSNSEPDLQVRSAAEEALAGLE